MYSDNNIFESILFFSGDASRLRSQTVIKRVILHSNLLYRLNCQL